MSGIETTLRTTTQTTTKKTHGFATIDTLRSINSPHLHFYFFCLLA